MPLNAITNQGKYITNQAKRITNGTSVNPIWNGLSSYYRLDETSGTAVSDTKGGITATASNLTEWNSSGKNNYCAKFNSTTSQISLDTTGSNYNFERTDSFSISMWYKRLATGGNPFLFSKSVVGGNWTGYGAYFDFDKIDFSILSNTSNWAHVLTTNTYTSTANWYHFVFTYNGSGSANDLLIYSNGVLQDTSKTHNTFLSGSSKTNVPFRIGNRNAGLGANAFIDEFSIWSGKVLTQSEITALYNSGNGLFY
jgi:hypothetical protein